VRGKMENAVTVLGSATPSMETYYNAVEKKFHYLSLPCRIDLRPLPEIQVVDMRQEKAEGKERPIFSGLLEEALRQNAERNEQALLFLNRRGFSTFALCRDCGFVYKCPNCSVSLIYHLSDKSFHCHYCGYTLPALSRCPACASIQIMLFGLGTQRLEEEIKKRLPLVRVGRMDRDTTGRKSSHQRILNQVRRGEVNLLIGTQMITKGHDLPRVTLVGVMAADLSLNIPDFRASERTFQLLTQVAGRAGRGSLPGKVIIQTYNPHHYSIQMARAQDFLAFYQQEAQFRQELAYPPFARLINLRLEGNSEDKILRYAKFMEQIALRILEKKKKFGGQVEMLGPSLAPLARLKGKCRCQILLKGKRWATLHEFTELILEKAEEEISLPGVKMIVDVDPVDML
jgi:primosomal protein N' (replication factor Y)